MNGEPNLDDIDTFKSYSIYYSLVIITYNTGFMVIYWLQFLVLSHITFESWVVSKIIVREKKYSLPELYYQAQNNDEIFKKHIQFEKKATQIKYASTIASGTLFFTFEGYFRYFVMSSNSFSASFEWWFIRIIILFYAEFIVRSLRYVISGVIECRTLYLARKHHNLEYNKTKW